MDFFPLITDQLIPFMGKRDKILPLNYTKWHIFELNFKYKAGLWNKFITKIYDLKDRKILDFISEENVYDFYYKNADIEFETLFNDDVLKKNYLFKIKDKIYAYGIGRKSKRSKNINYVRFYFDIVEFLNQKFDDSIQ